MHSLANAAGVSIAEIGTWDHEEVEVRVQIMLAKKEYFANKWNNSKSTSTEAITAHALQIMLDEILQR